MREEKHSWLFVRWCRHYIYFSKVLAFLLGLALAHGLVKNAVVDALMLYLTEIWAQPNLMKAAAVVNIEAVVSGVIAVLIYILTEAWVGRFKMVLFTTASFTLGLLLLWFSTWLLPNEMKVPIFYVALLLIAFGKAGKDPPFRYFIGDQLSGKDDEQVDDRTTFWWQVCRFLGAVISVFFVSNNEWKEIFLICASAMGATYLVFLAGICYPYNYISPLGNPFSFLYKVLKAAFAKRGLKYPLVPAGYFLNQRNELPLFPRDPFLRCIDKAAIVEQAFPSLQVEAELQEESDANVCTVAEVRQAKSLLRLIPLWSAFIIYGFVTAASNTFFIEQSYGLNEYIGDNFKLPINALFIIRSFVSAIASFLANLLLERYCSRNDTWKLKGALIRVGGGLGISIVCCEVAARVEHARLNREDMSILWLTPQYILIGLADGLSEEGLNELFYIFVQQTRKEIDALINQMMIGIGNVLSVGCVFAFRRWFGDTIDTSRLDKYFHVLMYLSLGNLLFYVLIGYYYVYIQKQETQFESYGAQQEEEEPVQELELTPALEQIEDEDEDEDVALVKKLKSYNTM